MNDQPAVHRIKKYMNRRYYDITNSRHLTMDDIYELVRSGQSVQVTDSQTGADITSHVLTQMILERDAPKLDIFPAGLLHQVIRANQQILHSFVERYFGNAFKSFLDSQQKFGDFMRRSGVPDANLAATPLNWARAWMTPARSAEPGAEPPPETKTDERAAISELRAQLAGMAQRIEQLQKEAAQPRAPRQKSKSHARARRARKP